MQIFLVRTSLVDGTHLSLEGRQLVRALASRIKLNEEPALDRLVTSPEPAAVQTAELFADRTDYLGVVEALPLLTQGTPPSVIVAALLERGTTIAVVADEPLLATIGAFLIGRPTFPPAVHAQVSLVRDRQPAWAWRPGEIQRPLLVA